MIAKMSALKVVIVKDNMSELNVTNLFKLISDFRYKQWTQEKKILLPVKLVKCRNIKLVK